MPTNRTQKLPHIETGELRQRIQIQSASYAPDQYGSQVVTWTIVATVWAQVQPLQVASPRGVRATEPFTQTELQPHNIVMAVTRYMGSLNVTPEMRFVHQGHTYLVRSVINVDNRNHELNWVGEEMLENSTVDA